mmetsp:Transcript_47919/g.113891  ORF Transcript_47919/g.113891 Transcript_47919/m.113891 type:complete len:615 (+) Transcript_47919:85-1929(+)
MGSVYSDTAAHAFGKCAWSMTMGHHRHPHPKEVRLVAIDPHDPYFKAKGSLPTSTRLSPFDIWESRFPLVIAFVYKDSSKLDFGRLASSLSKLLIKYPAIGGVYRKQGQSILVEHPEPRVEFILGTPEHDRHDDWSRGLFSQVVQASISCGMPVKEGRPLFEVRLTPITGGRCILSACISHGLADMHSIVRLMHDWAKITQGKADEVLKKAVVSDRSALLEGPDADPEMCEQAATEAMGWLEKPLLSTMVGTSMSVVSHKSTVREFYFSLDNIEKLKAVVRSGRAWKTFQERGLKLSAHDVLTALLWRGSALIRAGSPETVWPLTVVVNWRGRMQEITDEYWGNATTQPWKSFTKHQVMQMDLSEAALHVREIGDISDSDIKQIQARLSRIQRQKGAKGFIDITGPMTFLGRGVYISNFSKFSEMYEADFGGGSPEVVRMPQPPIPGVLYAYPDPTGAGGVCMNFTMFHEDSSQLAGFNFATGDFLRNDIAGLSGRDPVQAIKDLARNRGNIDHTTSHDAKLTGAVSDGRDLPQKLAAKVTQKFEKVTHAAKAALKGEDVPHQHQTNHHMLMVPKLSDGQHHRKHLGDDLGLGAQHHHHHHSLEDDANRPRSAR